MAASRGTVAGPVWSSAPGSGRSIDIPRPYLEFAADTLGHVKYMCESCGFIYDPAEGDPDGGIPPGTEFADIPDTWFCPVCGARKQDFAPYEE